MTGSSRICAWLLATSMALAPLPVRAQATAADNHIAYYQRILQRNPRDARTYHRLGDALIRKARESGDVVYFTRAEEALRKSLELVPTNAGAWRHLAYAAYSRHEFDQATVHARKALELDARDGHAWGVLGDALLETGRYPEAEDAYRRMMDIEVDLHALSRRAGLRSVRGDTAGAVADLERAVAEGRAARRPAESVAWALAQLASEHFAVGQLERAEARYLEALKTYPGYHRGLAGLAQVRAAQQRDEEAIGLYQRSIAVVPLPEYVAALGDVLARQGRVEEARRQYELVEYIGHLDTVNRTLYNRELAYFYADHDRKLETALDLARAELAVRRDVHAHDVLAWALLKNGRAAEARAAIAEALKVGTRDARLFFHAGLIHAALGENDQAREYLTRALATNPHFHVLHAKLAQQTLASLERRDLSGPGGSRGSK
jgi:tetratricopeptide (TPR) repeat protein